MSSNGESQSNSPPTELFSILGKILESTPTDTPQNEPPTNAEQKKSGGDMLSSLLSNPEIISKLPQILSMIKPIMEGMSASSVPASTTPSQASAKSESPQSLPAEISSGHTHRSPDCRATLLYAMKPYLNRERQEAIDYIVKLSKLGDILKSL